MTLHTMTVTNRKIKQHCEPARGTRYRAIKGTGGKLLVRVTDNRVVTFERDDLTADELATVQNILKTAENAAKSIPDGRLDYLWAKKAIGDELAAIGRLHDDNPHRPDSEFWACLIRIASVVKGSGRAHFGPSRIKTAVLNYAPTSLKTKGNREKDLEYLFGRAMNQAKPRYRIKGVRQ